MRSIAATLLTLYLLRLPLVTSGLELEETPDTSSISRQHDQGPWIPVQIVQRAQMGACQQQQLHRELSELLFELSEIVARRTPNLSCGSAHKRNSELINSLLGLPKVMNDAGRK